MVCFQSEILGYLFKYTFFVLFSLPFHILFSHHFIDTYRLLSHDVTAAILVSQNNETAAMLVSQTNPVRVELFSYANAFFCSNKFAWMLATWVKTLFKINYSETCIKRTPSISFIYFKWNLYEEDTSIKRTRTPKTYLKWSFLLLPTCVKRTLVIKFHHTTYQTPEMQKIAYNSLRGRR